MAVPLIISTAYQDRFVVVIQCCERLFIPVDIRVIAIIESFYSSFRTFDSAGDAKYKQAQICSHTAAKTVFEWLVKIHTSASGLCLITQHGAASQKGLRFEYKCAYGSDSETAVHSTGE